MNKDVKIEQEITNMNIEAAEEVAAEAAKKDIPVITLEEAKKRYNEYVVWARTGSHVKEGIIFIPISFSAWVEICVRDGDFTIAKNEATQQPTGGCTIKKTSPSLKRKLKSMWLKLWKT